jgi:hypothetical protein
MGVKVELTREHSRSPITGIRLAWWRKEGEEFTAALYGAKPVQAVPHGTPPRPGVETVPIGQLVF